MPRPLLCLILTVLSCFPSGALASFQMFCELEGEVVSTPVFTDIIAFEFEVSSSRDIEVDGLGTGWLDCHLLQGKRIEVALKPGDAGKRNQISLGDQLTLERYEIDVIVEQTGEITRSVKHVLPDQE